MKPGVIAAASLASLLVAWEFARSEPPTAALDSDAGLVHPQTSRRAAVQFGKLTVDDEQRRRSIPVTGSLDLTSQGSVFVESESQFKGLLLSRGLQLREAATFVVERDSELRAQRGSVKIDVDEFSKGELRPLDGNVQLEVTLKQGQLRAFLASSQAFRIGGRRAVVIRAKAASTVWVSVAKDGPKIEVFAGEVEVTHERAPLLRLAASEVAVLTNNGLVTERRPAPVMMLPPHRAVRVFWSKAQEVGLKFGAGPARIEVARDPEFKHLLVASASGDSLSIPAPLEGAVYWRRQGEQTSSSARFSRDEPAAGVTPMSDTIAESGLKATVYFQTAVPTLTFTFSPQPEVRARRFRVYEISNRQTPVIDKSVANDRVIVETGILGEGSYVWSAVGISKSGAEAPGGRMNKLDLVFRNSVSQLVIHSPKEGERSTRATGVAPKGAQLFINGTAVPIDSSGRFATSIDRLSTVVFWVVEQNGEESVWVRRVLR